MPILELRNRIRTLPTLEKRMEQLINEIQTAEIEMSKLLSQYERESRDVDRMQKDSFSSFLLRLVGKYEDKLEKEQREEINAKIAYDRAIAHLETLVKDKDELATRITALMADERTYKAELDSRRRGLRLSEPDGILYAELMAKRNAIISQITEIEEALKVVSRAMSTAEKIAKSLSGAEDWATFDAFTRGGFITHMAKYSHIDEAEENFNVLSNELRRLKSELSDVEGLTIQGLNEISSDQRVIDFWFDNIFTDWSVRNQIKDNAEKINHLMRDLIKTEKALKSKLSEKDIELVQSNHSEEALLLSI